MSKKPVQRVKHVPQRTCVGCRSVIAKRQLVRVVRTADGVVVDPTGKLAGRGAYLHDRRSCWEIGLRGSLVHALKVERLDLEAQASAALVGFMVYSLGKATLTVTYGQ